MSLIREGAPADLPALEALYPAAFPDEDLLPLLRALLAEGPRVRSLVAEAEGALAGHACVTLCDVGDAPGAAALLGPVAVAPAFQRRGLGRTLIEAARDAAAAGGAVRLCVLGDPAFYGRFGFTAERDVAPPFPLPEAWRDAWQGLPLSEAEPPRGDLRPPGPWRDLALWAP